MPHFWAAFVHPELFGRVGSLWPVIFGPELAKIMPRADKQPLVIYHTWGTYHIRSPHEAWDQVVENRAFFPKTEGIRLPACRWRGAGRRRLAFL